MYPIARTPSEILSPWEPGLLPMVLYVLAVALALAVILALIYRPGAKSPTPDKQRVYESGVIPSDDAQYDIPVHFYMIPATYRSSAIQSCRACVYQEREIKIRIRPYSRWRRWPLQ